MMGLRAVRLPGFTYCFEVSGLNLERFVNLLSKDGIPLLRIQRTDTRTLKCECYSCDAAAITALAEQKGWRIARMQPLGWSARLLWLKRRPGIPAGALLALVAILLLSRHVWRVDIRGAGSYQADLSSFLTESGYAPGRLRKTVDAQELTYHLTRRYPQLSWFHVYVSGVTLVVDVTPGAPMPALPSKTPADLVAQYDGIIDSVRVSSGTPVVKAGDIVRKGQVLIRGTERASDGQFTAVAASGVVMARCWQSYTVQMPMHDIESRETGRETVLWAVSTPFWQQPVPNPDYLAYNTYMEELPIAGCFFPFTLKRITQREVSMQFVPRDAQKVRHEAAEAALKQLKSKLHGYEIIDKWVDYCMIEGDTLAATATVEWLMDIGAEQAP